MELVSSREDSATRGITLEVVPENPIAPSGRLHCFLAARSKEDNTAYNEPHSQRCHRSSAAVGLRAKRAVCSCSPFSVPSPSPS
ncbi:hypothetical protein V6N13_042348 [Hibiscus sabdariffa]